MSLDKLADVMQDLFYDFDLSSDLEEHLKFAGSNKFLEEQMASVLIEPGIVSGFKSEDILNDRLMSELLVELPRIDIGLQELKTLKALSQVSDFKGDVKSVERDDNSIGVMFSDLKLPSKLKPEDELSLPCFGGLGAGSKLGSLLNLDTNMLDLNFFKSLSDFDEDSMVVPNNFKLKENSVASKGTINDVTYSDFERKRIEDMLSSTGKFDNQVDMNDFIRKTCGLKSLLSKVETTPDALFDTVKLASSLKGTNSQFDANSEAVSVIYDLFKRDGLSFLKNDVGERDNFSEFSGTGMSFDEGVKQRFCDACLNLDPSVNAVKGADISSNLGAGMNIDIGSNLIDDQRRVIGDLRPDSFGLINDMRGDDMHMLVEEVREFLSWACGIDLERSIIEPLGMYFTNMERAINGLRDAIMFNMQGVSLQDNMQDYKMGSEISRMP
ncbi:hypothetical protein A7978_04650 (plasmid) [Borrelia turicatae]|uniref:Uncharacterized protein n=1 Tax=Borrelia turicatae TaxID=142 RepID=A0A172XCX2_BORTU|nr:hypothetical protein [Borrelia turicatae]ANF34402.1 hypothetical protein A7978_04650 [Borrelia turicatae]UPA15479.1 hypothetical protein btBTE5EL_001161 [Borrelia turicatae]